MNNLVSSKESKDFSNPLNSKLEVIGFDSQIMDCSTKSDEAILIKTQVIEFLEDCNIQEHQKQRIIRAANNLLALL